MAMEVVVWIMGIMALGLVVSYLRLWREVKALRAIVYPPEPDPEEEPAEK